MQRLKLLAAILLFGIGATLQMSAAQAGVSCNSSTITCTWTSPFGSARGVYVTLGLDANNVLRWVASPVGDPNTIVTDTITGAHQSVYRWTFIGTSNADAIVEIPYGYPTLPHGPYRLHGGFYLSKVNIHSGAGNDILMGGDHTAVLDTSGSSSSSQQYTSISIIHPNSPGDRVNARVEALQPGGSFQIVGPSLASTQTHADGINLIGPYAGRNGTAVECNLSGKPIGLMLSEQPNIDMRFGPTNNASANFNENPNIANACVLIYLSVQYALTHGGF